MGNTEKGQPNLVTLIRFISQLLAFEFVKEPFARLLEHIDNEVESLATLIIWVGNIVVTLGECCKVVAHTVDFVYILARRSQATDTLIVAIIHHNDAIEFAEVIDTEWSRAVSEAVATTVCSLSHTGIGQFARVSRVCSCRVNLELIAQTTGKNLLTEDLLRHR